MQFKFLTTLLLVGACLAQVSQAQLNIGIQQTDIVGVLINQAKEAIETVQNVINVKISDALNDFNQLKDQVNSIAQEAIATIEERLNNVISDAQKQIQELTGEISACIAVSEDQFKELFTDFLNGGVQCVQNEIDSAFKIINESIAIVNEVRGEVQALPKKLSDCGKRLSSIACVNGVISETALLETQLPLKIAKQVAEATTYVAGLKVRLEVCITYQVAEAGIKAVKIVAQVGQCAAEAIGDNIQN